MEVIEHDLEYKSRSDVFTLWPLGDIHAGSAHCAENEIRKAVKEIQETKNALWLGMGDMADCITLNDKRFDSGGLASWVAPDNILRCQSDWLKELFSPIRKKCLGLLSGNHEEAIHLKHQEDFTRNLCRDLDVPYGGYSCFVNLTFGRLTPTEGAGGTRTFKQIHAFHGAGAAQTEGARLNRLLRLVGDFKADIYLMGHLHAITIYPPQRIGCTKAGKIQHAPLVAAITGSWLKAYTQGKNPSYAEMKGYKPSRIGAPIIKIQPDKDIFTVEVA